MKQKKWKFIYNKPIGGLSIVDEDSDTILNNRFSPQSSPDMRIPCDVRDWRLIAAAPQMLDSLKKLLHVANNAVPMKFMEELDVVVRHCQEVVNEIERGEE